MERAKLGGRLLGVIVVLLAATAWAPRAAAQGVLPSDAKLVQASPADPMSLYAVAGRQVYRSTDKGGTWAPVGATPSRIKALALAPNDSEQLYAGTESAGLWRSQDGGLTWHESNRGLKAGPGSVTEVTAIAVDPEDPAILYAATGVWLGTARAYLTPMQVAFSLDGGTTWLPLAALGPGSRPVTQLAPVEGLPFTLLAFDDQGNATMHRADVQALLDVTEAEHEPAARRNAAAEALNMLLAPVPGPTSFTV